MDSGHPGFGFGMSRRDFLQLAGVSGAAGLALGFDAGRRKTVVVRGAFVYPPTRVLSDIGYYSWPGSGFKADSQQLEYARRFGAIEERLGMRIVLDPDALDTDAGVTEFIEEIAASSLDGLLLVPFKRGHWPRVKRILDETRLPTVVLATLGVLHIDQVGELQCRPNTYLVDSLDAVEKGLREIRDDIAAEMWGRKKWRREWDSNPRYPF